MSAKIRIAGLALSLSAVGFGALLSSEAFVPTAMRPVPGDEITIGYGSTAGVKLGDTITEPAARQRAAREIRDNYEKVIKLCAADVPMSQGEFDAVVDLAYNVGAEKVCKFSIIPKFRAGRYAEGCAAILTVDMFNGKHCRDPENLKRINGCRGIMNRRQKEYATCMGY